MRGSHRFGSSWSVAIGEVVGGQQGGITAEGDRRFGQDLVEEQVGDVVVDAARGDVIRRNGALHARVAPPVSVRRAQREVASRARVAAHQHRRDEDEYRDHPPAMRRAGFKLPT